MAGIEQIEVHSRSYIVRWVRVVERHTISWSIQPHKKSINFGIVKHPGSGATALTIQPVEGLDSAVSDAKVARFAKRDITAQDQLASKGFTVVKWVGKCEADRLSTGTFDIPAGQAGMYGLVFDNTFSKQTSKTATFVLLTYPTDSPPQTSHHLVGLGLSGNANASRTSLGRHGSPDLNAAASESIDSLHSHPGVANRTRGSSAATATATATTVAASVGAGGSVGGASGPVAASGSGSNGSYHTGTLMKRRRKKGQGYARRFFSLDYSSCTLSYYQNRNSSALRGAIPLSLAAIAADESRREINIDSGAEIWHLRASNQREFAEWARALEKASRISRSNNKMGSEADCGTMVGDHESHLAQAGSRPTLHTYSPDEASEWAQVETIVSRIVGTRDALCRLATDISVEPPSTTSSSANDSLSAATAVHDDDNSLASGATGTMSAEKRSIWKRKPSSTHLHATATSQAQMASESVDGATCRKLKACGGISDTSFKSHCEMLLADLDSALSEFRILIASNKQRRAQSTTMADMSRMSIDSTSTADEFFDAEAGGEGDSRIVRIDNCSEDETPESDDEGSVAHDSSSISSMEDAADLGGQDGNLYPAKPKNLNPLPIEDPIKRRSGIPPSTALPPSLIAFVRKNVGKDLSTISMPVSANEPISLLQKVAEQLEYAQLLQRAAVASVPKDRLILVTAFAISQFSSSRAKERSIRKPFNPFLGETFELVRTDKEVPGGFRLLVEKVCHRPVRVAMQADSAAWSFSQSPAPAQKFWGKSAEITTEGRVRVVLRLPSGQDELYSWSIATMFLRNVVMGEKYVEPVGTMTITNESTSAKAVVEFPAKGMFGGRAEDVQVDIIDENGSSTGTKIVGNWTQSLRVSEKGKPGEEIWKVGKLVNNAAQTYGLTEFGATLNEITTIERGRLPATDTRLRPDQRLAEEGDLESAEEMKTDLEEAQRARRRKLEEAGETYKPRWFVQVDSPNGDEEEVWKMKTGKDSYWEERAKGNWQGITEIFKVD
ncbi:Oxysterol-binding protein 3 [Ceratocystis pirilliformis]|uniref:Oxysterol-binding protein 3 n=1 Tax=Ceratocystis pirilliformis TaxID=259994 RepID=A0ABR3ZLR3_9PEZI